MLNAYSFETLNVLDFLLGKNTTSKDMILFLFRKDFRNNNKSVNKI
jgi:hypothetical protein